MLAGLLCTQRTTSTEISIFFRCFLSRSLFSLGADAIICLLNLPPPHVMGWWNLDFFEDFLLIFVNINTYIRIYCFVCPSNFLRMWIILVLSSESQTLHQWVRQKDFGFWGRGGQILQKMHKPLPQPPLMNLIKGGRGTARASLYIYFLCTFRYWSRPISRVESIPK